MRKLFTIALVLSVAFVTQALAPGLRFKQIGLAQGLSHTTVTSVAQDRDGYMWVATPDGLNRYDGYAFKVYRHNEQPNSVPGNVRLIRFDADGNMWLAGSNVLSRFDATTESFLNYPFASKGDINDILPVSKDLVLLATTTGVYSFHPSTGQFTAGFDGKRFNRHVQSLSLSGSNIYIAAGSGGLWTYSTADKSLQRLPVQGNPNVFLTLPDGVYLLIATEGSGMLRYNIATGESVSFRANGPEGLGSDFIRSMAHDGNGHVWVGTFNGLDILNEQRTHFTHYNAVPNDSESLSHSSVRSIYADHQGGMWLGTFFGGLNYYHPLKNQFQNLRHTYGVPSLNDNVVGTMTEDARGRIWIATNNGGVNVYSPADGSYTYYSKAQGLGSNDVKAIYIDEDKATAYVGAHLGGLSTINIHSGAVRRLGGLPANVFGIAKSRKPGHLWLVTLDSLLLYDTAKGSTVAYPSYGLSHMTDLYRDASGRLWVSGEDGLMVFHETADGQLSPAREIPAEISKLRKRVNNVYNTRDGKRICISTNGCLIIYNQGTKTVTRYTAQQGMPNNIVYGVLEDDNGRLWCSTNGGLAFINLDSNKVRSYSVRDGLQSNQFNNKSMLRSQNGYLYFGGINGLTFFNPAALVSNPYAPEPKISGIQLFNNEVRPGDDTGVLEKSISHTERIVLRPDQTVFTIDFTVCNYVAGSHNTFMYTLEGLDKQWYTIEGKESVTYSNLPAGKYKFLLRAANNDGVWSDNTTSLEIVIQARWYNRWWARSIFALLILAAVGGVLYVLWHRRELQQKQSIADMDHKRETELNEMKVRFFINMSHELRTPLTLITLPLQELLQKATDRKEVQKLSIIKNNVDRILHIVNQLLDYRRAELGMFRLQVRPVHVNELLHKIFSNYEYQASRRGIAYVFDSTVPDIELNCDPHYIELICNNLIANAFKYTPRGQSISVCASLEGGESNPQLRISVTDTGCGIAAENLPNIFNRFYQVNDHAGGSGIGLSLVKRLIELHHGSITADSKLGEGTSFTFVLPVGEEAYLPTERSQNTAAQLPDVSTVVPLDFVEESEEDEPAEQPSDSDANKRETILVVDDNPEILKYICECLQEQYKVIAATNGAKAIDLLGSENIDLIITDIMMPDIDGVQLCRTVKRNLRTSHIPVIMLSAKSEDADQLDGFKAGADDYISKPFSMELLLGKIRNQLRTRRLAIAHFTSATEVATPSLALNPLDEEFLNKAFRTVEKYLDDSEFSADIFASEMCMSRSNLHLKLKALTGESTSEFIRRYRMTKAMELLKTGRHTIQQVSMMVGYGTPSYFATTFKKFFGELPSEVR